MSLTTTIARDGTGEPCPDCGAKATHRVEAQPVHHRCFYCGNSWEIDGEQRDEVGKFRAEIDRLRREIDRLAGLAAGRGAEKPVQPPTPAAIVTTWEADDRSMMARTIHAFADPDDARRFAGASPEGVHRYVEMRFGWRWHERTKGEDCP